MCTKYLIRWNFDIMKKKEKNDSPSLILRANLCIIRTYDSNREDRFGCILHAWTNSWFFFFLSPISSFNILTWDTTSWIIITILCLRLIDELRTCYTCFLIIHEIFNIVRYWKNKGYKFMRKGIQFSQILKIYSERNKLYMYIYTVGKKNIRTLRNI